MSETRNRGDHLWELEFIIAIFTWIFNFLSRSAEPLMTLAVIYTIIVAGIPHAYQPALYNIAVAAMIGSPESILPGAFILAGQEQRSGNKHVWMLEQGNKPTIQLVMNQAGYSKGLASTCCNLVAQEIGA